MNTIYKYEIPIDGEFTLELPLGARILSVQAQPQDGLLMNNDKVFIWAIVNPYNEKIKRKFHVHGTGNPLYDHYKYIGTFQVYNGRLVWHLFEGRI